MNTIRSFWTGWENFWIRFIRSEKPGLLTTAISYFLLVGSSCLLIGTSKPFQLAILGSRIVAEVMNETARLLLLAIIAIFLVFLWPMETILASAMEQRIEGRSGDFKKLLLHIVKAWVFQGVVVLSGIIVTTIIASQGWLWFARICFVFWPIFFNVIWWAYPIAIKEIYGDKVRANLIFFLSSSLYLIVFVTVGVLVTLAIRK